MMNIAQSRSASQLPVQHEHLRTTMSCSKPSLLRNAMHLNNKATELISNGEYDQAITTLSAALVQLKHAIRCPGGDLPMSDSSSTTSSSRRPLRFLMEDDEHCSGLFGDLPDEDQEWYLYRYPVQIHDIEHLNTPDCIEVISFAGIYNLGLCHHLQALAPTLNDSRQLRLQRATSFYEHSQKLLANNQAIMDPDMIHSLVIANNMGHAHYHRGNETTGKMCFQQLLNAIMYISDNVGSENLVASDKNRWDGFMVNIMQHLIGKTSHAAAA